MAPGLIIQGFPFGIDHLDPIWEGPRESRHGISAGKALQGLGKQNSSVVQCASSQNVFRRLTDSSSLDSSWLTLNYLEVVMEMLPKIVTVSGTT